MVSRKSVLMAVLAIAMVPAAYVNAGCGECPAKIARFVSKPLDFALDTARNVLHQDSAYGQKCPVTKYARALVSLTGMYYIATHEKTQTAVNKVVEVVKNAIFQKKGVCTKKWSKDCGACPKTCGETAA